MIYILRKHTYVDSSPHAHVYADRRSIGLCNGSFRCLSVSVPFQNFSMELKKKINNKKIIVILTSATSRKIYYKLISLCDLHINKIVTCARVFHVLGIYTCTCMYTVHSTCVIIRMIYSSNQFI